MQQNGNPGSKQLRQKLEGVSRVTGYVAGNIAVFRPELGANAHLQGRHISLDPRSVHVNPMFAIVEVEEHG